MRINFSLRKKLILTICVISAIYFGSLLTLYFSSKAILVKNLEGNLASSMETLFKMLETNYEGVKDYREKETQVVKNKMLTTVDHLYDYANKVYARVKAGEISLAEAKDIVWKYYLTVKMGKSGYVYIVIDDGTCILHPKEGVAGHNWNIPEEKYDFVRWQMTKVRGYKEYMWQNVGEIHLREKAIAQRYFQPFGWIITVSAYRHEFSLLVDMTFIEQTEKNLGDAVRSLKFGKNGYAFCMSPNYVMIIDPQGGEGQSIRNTELGKLLAEPNTLERSRKETVVLHYKWQNPGEKTPSNKVLAFRYFAPYDWIVGMTAYPNEFTGGIYDIMIKTGFFIFITLLFFTILLLFFMSKSIIDPIVSLTRTVEKYGDGDLTVRTNIAGHDEIGYLANKFNFMLEQLQEAQRQLIKRAEEKYQHIFENAVEGIFQSTPDGRFIIANPALCNMLGYQSQEELMSSITQIDEQLSVDEAQCKEIVKQIKEKKMLRGFECQYYCKDGSTIWVKINVQAISDTNGKVSYYEGTIENISEKRQAEQALKESELFFADIIEFLPDATMAINKEGKVIVWNRALEEMTGIKAIDILGKGHDEYSLAFYGEKRPILIDLVLQSDADTEKKYLFVKKNKDIFIGETEALVKGENRYLWGKASPLRDSRGNIIGAIEAIRDVTERKYLESQVLHAQKMEAIGTLAGGIAHDFNNLLMGILGRISLMKSDADSPELQNEHMENIEKCIDSATDLTRKLLGFARKGKYDIKPTDINDILQKTSDMFGRTRKEIKVHTQYQENIWSVEVDKGQVEQVFMNLYLNALQAMPVGGELYLKTENIILIEGDIEPYGLHQGKYVKIAITDTGLGMDKQTQQRIFEPFFTTKEMGRGTGLGLASVYGIIKSHSGIINVYSELGKGSTFNIYLPATDKELVKEIPNKEITSEILTGTETVLLIDDENMILDVNRRLLQKLGYTVLTAKNGKEAINVYQKNTKEIKLVLLDMIMPEMSGGETFDKLKVINPQIKVLLSSGYSINGEARKIMERGVEGFIQKPFYLNALSKKIREILDEK